MYTYFCMCDIHSSIHTQCSVVVCVSAIASHYHVSSILSKPCWWIFVKSNKCLTQYLRRQKFAYLSKACWWRLQIFSLVCKLFRKSNVLEQFSRSLGRCCRELPRGNWNILFLHSFPTLKLGLSQVYSRTRQHPQHQDEGICLLFLVTLSSCGVRVFRV
jgi:hypothetical protein